MLKLPIIEPAADAQTASSELSVKSTVKTYPFVAPSDRKTAICRCRSFADIENNKPINTADSIQARVTTTINPPKSPFIWSLKVPNSCGLAIGATSGIFK